MDTPATSAHTAPRLGDVTDQNGDTWAYLIVHAESDRAPRLHASPWQRLRAWCRLGRRSGVPDVLSLTLVDRHGHTVLSLPDADPVLGVALAPGTYHLRAVRGHTQRGYTVSLPAGSRFDLHLRFSLCERPNPASVTSWPARSAG